MDRDITTPRDLKKLFSKVLTQSLESKIKVDVSFGNSVDEPKDLQFNCYFNFSKDGELFFISLHQFYPYGKNEELAKMATDLMKNPSLFNEIREKAQEM